MGKLILVIIILLVIGAFIIVNQSGLDLGEKEGKISFVKQFGSWLLGLAKNVKSVTSYAVKMDWMPKNQSNESNSS